MLIRFTFGLTGFSRYIFVLFLYLCGVCVGVCVVLEAGVFWCYQTAMSSHSHRLYIKRKIRPGDFT